MKSYANEGNQTLTDHKWDSPGQARSYGLRKGIGSLLSAVGEGQGCVGRQCSKMKPGTQVHNTEFTKTPELHMSMDEVYAV